MVRCGIEFDEDQRRVAYHFYKEHPGETMFYPLDAIQFMEVPADDVSHVYKPLRVGQLRGEPMMTRVLTLLYELDQYTDAELLRKKVAAMFAGFITKPVPEDQILPPAPFIPNPQNVEQPLNPVFSPQQDVGTDISKLEPGTLQDLYPGEGITFPQVPDSPDFVGFLNVQLHKFAAGCNMTYEQLTGDLKGVTYSSIRAGLLEFRRACEQIQYNVFVQLGCRRTMKRWLKEGVLVGALDLPGYFQNPSQYENVIWVPPGWEWVDPLKEVQAAQSSVRNGFTSRTIVVRENGHDPEEIDAQQAEERLRSQKLGITYDSDPNKVLIGRETQPDAPGTAKPTEETKIESEDESPQAEAFGVPLRRHKKTNGRIIQ
jgi:lambda family phage portal protein